MSDDGRMPGEEEEVRREEREGGENKRWDNHENLPNGKMRGGFGGRGI